MSKAKLDDKWKDWGIFCDRETMLDLIYQFKQVDADGKSYINHNGMMQHLWDTNSRILRKKLKLSDNLQVIIDCFQDVDEELKAQEILGRLNNRDIDISSSLLSKRLSKLIAKNKIKRTAYSFYSLA